MYIESCLHPEQFNKHPCDYASDYHHLTVTGFLVVMLRCSNSNFNSNLNHTYNTRIPRTPSNVYLMLVCVKSKFTFKHYNVNFSIKNSSYRHSRYLKIKQKRCNNLGLSSNKGSYIILHTYMIVLMKKICFKRKCNYCKAFFYCNNEVKSSVVVLFYNSTTVVI